MQMANVIITSYTRNKKDAKRTVRYITHRPGKDQKQTTRTINGIDGVLEKHHAYQMIDAAGKGTVFFRIVISPDPKKEDIKRDIYPWQITEHTMLKLEERLQKQVQFIAAEHNDHTDIRHVHVLACVKAEASLFQRKERNLARGAEARKIEEVQWEI